MPLDAAAIYDVFLSATPALIADDYFDCRACRFRRFSISADARSATAAAAAATLLLSPRRASCRLRAAAALLLTLILLISHSPPCFLPSP